MSVRNYNQELLSDFAAYCEAHPEQRFWQALRNWSGASMIYLQRPGCEQHEDTYSWAEKFNHISTAPPIK
jgi:hypothetical protein